ncbi:hypothetical protein CPIN18021_0268 [Campylobacter pinnipediorum subsp. caledonicus]|uniref:Uncharacterized protein n=1 Tax=Campylobacter pinnipediorum subsp. caledonicus TaxID=1874362 RepID=A0A1S6U609_9BACT|nr:hypothetical protein [Campylobacter pinnipediorum]AQW87115.1 hypothetical protein CPIN18021_0268 [Campylobacter pinnipediorum subsp. caledonicus]
MREFIPIQYFDLSNTTKKDIQNLYYRDKQIGRTDRFMIENGQLLVHNDYKCPHFHKVADLYYKALECANSQRELAKFVAKQTGKDINTVYFYFRNFRFKNPDFAQQICNLLKRFIKENNLFGDYDE